MFEESSNRCIHSSLYFDIDNKKSNYSKGGFVRFIFSKYINDFAVVFYVELNVSHSLYSSVVEHWSRKPGVVSSNLTGGMGIEFVQQVCFFKWGIVR